MACWESLNLKTRKYRTNHCTGRQKTAAREFKRYGPWPPARHGGMIVGLLNETTQKHKR